MKKELSDRNFKITISTLVDLVKMAYNITKNLTEDIEYLILEIILHTKDGKKGKTEEQRANRTNPKTKILQL